MSNALRKLTNLFRPKSSSDRKLSNAFKVLMGKSPINLGLYKLALTHASTGNRINEEFRESNERLEYLGDAVLSAIVAEYLFKKYPYKPEGFLTEIRSRIVSRESLNNLGKKLGVIQLMKIEGGIDNRQVYSSVFGNTLEAIVGAIYLDLGYTFCRKFVISKLIIPNFNLGEIINNTKNFKSALVEWGQGNNSPVTFEILEVKDKKKFKEFTAQVFIDGKPYEKGFGPNKKKAEQDAASKTLKVLNVEI